MKVIDNLTIKVTYTVGLVNVKVPDKIYDALCKCYEEGGNVPLPDDCMIKCRKDLAEAAEWLSDNIQESDAMDWEYEIESLND